MLERAEQTLSLANVVCMATMCVGKLDVSVTPRFMNAPTLGAPDFRMKHAVSRLLLIILSSFSRVQRGSPSKREELALA